MPQFGCSSELFCVCVSFYLFFSCSIFFLVPVFLFRFSFYLTVSLYVLSLRWPWSLSWACKMCKVKICVEEKKVFYIQIIMKNNGDRRSVWRTTFLKRKKKNKRIFRRLQTSPIQVVKFCSSASSSLVFCLQVRRYICYLIKTARKKQKKERKKSLLTHGWRFSTAVGIAVLGLEVWEGLIGD